MVQKVGETKWCGGEAEVVVYPTPTPIYFLVNRQSMDNKMDKLQCRVDSERDMRDCHVVCFTET